MNRLTEREPNWIDDELYMSACEPSDETVDEIYRRLKYYEDAEEQGLLVVLPCKMGHPVFRISDGYVAIVPLFWLRDVENFGKTVFLTEQEAEKALEKMKNK